MINLSGQSGEKMDLIQNLADSPPPLHHAALPPHNRYGNRVGLMTSSSNTRPTAMGKNLNQLCNQKESLQSLRRTFYNNSNLNQSKTRLNSMMNQPPNTTGALVVAPSGDTQSQGNSPLVGRLIGTTTSTKMGQNRGIVRGLGGIMVDRRKSVAGGVVGLENQRMPIEIKKPNISDIKRKD